MARTKNTESVAKDDGQRKGRKKMDEEKIVEFNTDEVVVEEAPAEVAEDDALLKVYTELEQKNNKLLRLMADFENYKKRNADNYSKGYVDGAVESLKAILPLLDGLDRAEKTTEGEQLAGIKQLKKLLDAALSGLGVKEIEAQGVLFDPKVHNAVMSVDDKENSGYVIEVFQKGFTYRDKVIRHSMVKVAN